MRQRITYSVSKDGQLIKQYGKVPLGNRLMDSFHLPFDQQMMKAHKDLESSGKYDSRKTEYGAGTVKKAWA